MRGEGLILLNIPISHFHSAMWDVGLTAWATEGRKGQSQAGPKGPKPARRATS